MLNPMRTRQAWAPEARYYEGGAVMSAHMAWGDMSY